MGGSKKTTKKDSTKQSLLPEYMREGSERAVKMASDRTDQQYEAYGGQRIADMSQNEQMGMGLARSGVNIGEEEFAASRGALDKMGSFTDEGVADQYMNPYMKQVMDPALRRKNEAFEAERADRKSKRGMQGAFGGRGQMWENKFSSDFQRDQDEMMKAGYGAAFESAQGMHAQEQQRNLQQAQAYAGLGETKVSANRNRISDLMASGLVERTRDQAAMDFKYIEHIEERDWDVNNLDSLVKTLANVPHDMTQTEKSKTVEKTKPNAMKVVAGVAMIAAGVMTGGTAFAAFGPALVSGGAGMAGGA